MMNVIGHQHGTKELIRFERGGPGPLSSHERIVRMRFLQEAGNAQCYVLPSRIN